MWVCVEFWVCAVCDVCGVYFVCVWCVLGLCVWYVLCWCALWMCVLCGNVCVIGVCTYVCDGEEQKEANINKN